MIQPFTTLCLDPQQIIRGKRGVRSLSYVPPHCVAYSKELALVLGKTFFLVSGFHPFRFCSFQQPWSVQRGVLQDWLPARGQPQEVQQPRGTVLGKGLHLGHRGCTWEGNQNPSWQPGLPTGREHGDTHLFLPLLETSLLRRVPQQLALWNLQSGFCGGMCGSPVSFGYPQSSVCTASCLVFSSAAFTLLCCFSCPYLYQNYHY